MGKRRDYDSMERPDEMSIKRHKKHKRHKPPEDNDEGDDNYVANVPSENECVDVETDIMPITPPVRLLPPIERQRTSINSKLKSTPQNMKSGGASTSVAAAAATSKKRNRRGGKESGTSSDEERWLDAIESGKLEDVDDELKKIKDPKLMTARQRAMYERNTDKEPSPGVEILMSLPTGYKEKVMTAEAIQKAALKSQKRKQMADEKREKDKKKTMERLLKKTETKQRSNGKTRSVRTVEPMIRYRNTYDGATISLPVENCEFPLKAQTERDPPKPVLCGIPGCKNLKIYNCSKTNLPLCSIACYRKNLTTIREIMC